MDRQKGQQIRQYGRDHIKGRHPARIVKHFIEIHTAGTDADGVDGPPGQPGAEKRQYIGQKHQRHSRHDQEMIPAQITP